MTKKLCSTLFNYFQEQSYDTNIGLASAYICIAIMTVVVNLLLIIAMIGSKQALKNTSNVLITVMSCVDLINGLVSMPIFAIRRFIHQKINCLYTVLAQSLTTFLMYQSCLVVILIAIDRYLHMSTSLTRKKSFVLMLFNGKWIIFPIFCTTALSTAVSSIHLIIEEYGNMRIVVIIALGLVTLAPLLLIIVTSALYIRGYLKIRDFVRRNPVYNDYTCQSKAVEEEGGKVTLESKNKKPTYLRKLQKTVLMLLIALMVTYTPYVIFAAIRAALSFVGEEPNAILIVGDVSVLIFLCSFAINSLIIFKMNKAARSWLLKRIKC